MAIRTYVGGDLDGHTDRTGYDPEEKHPKVVIVFVWEEQNKSYHGKTYAQTHPEEG